MLSEAKRDEQKPGPTEKDRRLRRLRSKELGSQGSVSKLNEQYLKPIVDRVHKIVSDHWFG